MRIFVFGYYGCGNLGDEAILKSFSGWIANKFPEAKLIVQSSNPVNTRSEHGVDAVHKYDVFGMLRGIARSSAVVAPGGGLLQDSTSIRSLIYYALLIRIALLMGKTVYMLSQGIGPLKRRISQKISARVLKRCVHVAVRDDGSLEMLRKLGLPERSIERSGDLVLLGDAGIYCKEVCAKVPPGKDRPARIGLSLRPTEHLEHVTWAIIGCLLRLNEEIPIELRLFGLSREEDHAIMEKFLLHVKQRAPALKVSMIEGAEGAILSVDEFERSVAELDVMIGMRLHSLIFAARCGVPFVGLSYAPKVAAFARECGQHVIDDLANAEQLDLMHGVGKSLNTPDQARKDMSDGLARMRMTLAHAMERFRAAMERSLEGPRPLMGIPVSPRSFDGSMNVIYKAVEAGGKLHVATVNPEMLMLARKNVKFRELLLRSGLNTADGVGISVGYRLKYGRGIDRVPGVEIMNRLLAESHGRGLRLFLLGAKPEVVEKAARLASEMKESPIIAGFHHGYLKDVSQDELVEKINAANPHIILAGMGCPMQEFWISENMGRLNANVFIGVGGCLDVLAGEAKRAPAAMRKLGLEWLYRLAKQPSRIGRMAGLPVFLAYVAAEALVYRLRFGRKDVC